MSAPQKLSRSEWGTILILAAINFTHILDFVIVMPLGKRLMTELSLNEQQFAHIVSIYGFAAALVGISFAMIADRFDRKHSLLFAYAGFILATAFCGFASSYVEMMIARALSGAFGGLAASCILAVIGDAFADGRRGTAMGVVMSAFAVASIAGLPAGLWLANRFGRGVPFFAVAAFSVPILLLVVQKLPHYRDHLTAVRKNPARALFEAAVNPNHVGSFALMLTVVFGTFTIVPFIAPYMETNCGRSANDIPSIYAIAGLCTLIGLNIIGRLTDRFGKRPVFIALALSSMVMTLVLTHMTEVSYAYAAFITSAFMVTASGRGVPAQAMMLASADPAARGAFTSLNSFFQNVGIGTAPLFAGLFMGRDKQDHITGYGTAGSVAVGIAALGIGLSFLVKPAKQTPIKVPEQSAELLEVG